MRVLQRRWKLDGKSLIYYGLRNKKDLFNNKIKLSKKELNVIKSLPKELNSDEEKTLARLIQLKIVVDQDDLKKIPTSLEEATFCKNCSMNDFILPGVEFDENGLCPICQTKDTLAKLKGVNPIQNTFKRSSFRKKANAENKLLYTVNSSKSAATLELQGLRRFASMRIVKDGTICIKNASRCDI